MRKGVIAGGYLGSALGPLPVFRFAGTGTRFKSFWLLA